jgi:hypothetical protein
VHKASTDPVAAPPFPVGSKSVLFTPCFRGPPWVLATSQTTQRLSRTLGSGCRHSKVWENLTRILLQGAKPLEAGQPGMVLTFEKGCKKPQKHMPQVPQPGH